VELHHIDRNRQDSRPENLFWLCRVDHELVDRIDGVSRTGLEAVGAAAKSETPERFTAPHVEMPDKPRSRRSRRDERFFGMLGEKVTGEATVGAFFKPQESDGKSIDDGAFCLCGLPAIRESRAEVQDILREAREPRKSTPSATGPSQLPLLDDEQ
jgi:hypothetical protein